MERPFVVCHMFVSIDGKIDGAFMSDHNAMSARSEYGRLRDFYKADATIYGTKTMRAFADGLAPRVLPKAEPYSCPENYCAPHKEKQYIVAVDPEGILGWNNSTYERPGRGSSHVIEVLTGNASAEFKGHLQRQGVSYITAGENHLDCSLLLQKLKTMFGIKRIILAGGGYINGSFLQEDLIDEISIVIAPVADGNSSSVSIFERSDFLPEHSPAAFSFVSAERVSGDGLWLRYTQRK